MTSDVNLLQYQKRDRLQAGKSILLFRGLSILSVVLLLVSAVVVFYLRATSPIQSLQKEHDTLLSTLVSMRVKTVQYQIVLLKLKDITNIISGRPSLESIIRLVLHNLPSGVLMESFSIGNKKLSIAISSSSLSSINVFLDNMVALSFENKKFKRVFMNGIRFSEEKKYSSVIQIDLL